MRFHDATACRPARREKTRVKPDDETKLNADQKGFTSLADQKGFTSLIVQQ
jgi:hypothetical protein